MSKASKNEETRTIARRFIRVLDVKDGDVVVVKRHEETSNMDLFNGLRKALGASGRKNCIVVYANELEDVKKLHVKEMAEYGWVPAPKDEDDEEAA